MARNKTLGTILKNEIPELVIPELGMPPVAGEELKEKISEKLDSIIVALGKVIEKKFDAKVEEKAGEIDTETRNEALVKLGDKLAKKFAGAITEELQSDPEILKSDKKLQEKLEEIGEGYRQFSEEDIDAISKTDISTVVRDVKKTADNRVQAQQEEEQAREQEQAELQQLREQARRDAEEIERLKESQSRVQPRTPVREDPPSWTDRSYGRKC